MKVVSIVGGHAGELLSEIFGRKMMDIENCGKTFWVVRSYKIVPQDVRRLCVRSNRKGGKPTSVKIYFLDSVSSSGARPTTTSKLAKEYSKGKKCWKKFPKGLSAVSGKIDSATSCFVLDSLKFESKTFDIWQYEDAFNRGDPIRFGLGYSTVCALKFDMTTHNERMKKRYRGVVASARLVYPYCVYLR